MWGAMEQFSEKMGLRLRKARIARDKTQHELAVMAGVSSKVIGRMERGDASVTLAKWLSVADILGLLHTWQDVFLIAEDPFVEYDRDQQQITALQKQRVRHKKK